MTRRDALDVGRLERLNEMSLTRSFTPELDIDWNATTSDEEYESLYSAWSLFVGTGVDEELDDARRVSFVKYQQINLMLFTGLLERHGIAALSRLYDLESSQPFAEYVTHFIKEETYHYTMFTRAVTKIQDSMPSAERLPRRRMDRTLRWLFRGLSLVPGRKLQSNLTFSLFRFAEQVTIFAHQTARKRIPREESFINRIWAFHALDEARHLAFDDMILERNRLWWPIAWLPCALVAPCCIWLSLVLNANEVWAGRQLGLRVRLWHLPWLMRRTRAPFKRRVFGLLAKTAFGGLSAAEGNAEHDG
jgi:P-aminobenzoate N-oxygenase AurF